MQERFDPVTEQDNREREVFDAMTSDEQVKEKERLMVLAEKVHGKSFYEMAEKEKDLEWKEKLILTTKIAETVKESGGMALIVGGYARDKALERFGYHAESKDIDIEVYGIEFEKLQDILKQFGETNVVGASFAVIKLEGLDISIPRRDSKTGEKHGDFIVEGDPNMTIEEAARRRDFTINALGFDPLTGEIVDKFDGLGDIEKKVIRATDPKTFIEDPLRVLRAMQFAGRFEFTVDPETVELCRSLNLRNLSRERIGEEWSKLLLKSKTPSIGLQMAQELGIIDQLHPEFAGLEETPQDKIWHPEGDVWIHTKMVTDSAALICERENFDDSEKLIIMLASLFHDLGKPSTTETLDSGKVTSKGHSEAGIEPTRNFLNALKMPHDVIDKVLPLIREHLYPSQNKDASVSAVRRLALRMAPATIKELVMVGEADQRGRSTPWNGYPEGKTLLETANDAGVQHEKPKKLVEGRDLLALNIGIKPGPELGAMLRELFEAQLDGEFSTTEEGIEYFKANKK